MLTVPTRRFRTTLLAFLPTLLLIFSSCSLLNVGPTSSVTFTLHASREAFSGLEGLYMDVDLMGGYKDSQTISLSEGSQFKIEFDNVPIGTNVYVQAQIYQNYKGEKAILYTGKSESKTIEETDNTFAVKLESVYNYIANAQYSCLITKPLFNSSSGDPLQNNKLDYSSGNGSYYWKYDKLNEFQKVKVKLKQLAGSTPDNDISICLLNTQTNSSSTPESYTVSTNSSSCELLIPDSSTYNAIKIEYSAAAADGFICAIENIELQTIGSFELVDITMPEYPTLDVEVKVGSSVTTVSGTFQPGDNKTIKLTAPTGFTTYTWKINDEEKQTGSNNVYSFNTTTLTAGLIYEITLFADSSTQHESWTLQIRKSSS